jgi:uncharacterized protein (TIGR03067 family)
MLRFAPLVSLLLVSSAVAAPIPKDKLKDGEAIQGRWNVIELQHDGKPADKEFDGSVATFDKDTMTVKTPNRKGDDDSLTFKLDQQKKGIDLSPKKPGREHEMKGVYELDGDNLVIAIGMGTESVRPKQAKGGPGIALIKLQRVNEEKK